MTLPLPIPIEVVYAGLGGTLLALIVATAQQKWQPKVFFLLALRLAIGWHFLFEGMHKIHSHTVGPTETNRPFSSEPYFKASPTWFGAQMRKQYDDPQKLFAERLTPPKPIDPKAFYGMKAEEWAAVCPATVAADLDKLEEQAANTMKTAAEAEIKAIQTNYAKGEKVLADEEQKATAAAKDDAGKKKVKEEADAVRAAAAKSRDTVIAELQKVVESSAAAAKQLLVAARAKYARWVYGADGRETKVKFVTGPVSLTAPQRLAHIEHLRKDLAAAEGERTTKLGNGTGTAMKRTAELRTELSTAEAELSKDALSFVTDLRADMGLKPVETVATAAADLASEDAQTKENAERFLKDKLKPTDLEALREASKTIKDQNSPEWEKRIDAQYTFNRLVRKADPKPGELQDTLTSWFIAGVGACLMIGLFTRINCVLAAGFLVTTYLTWPSFPWLPQPPNTEGNPLFINKNVIECLALLSLACLPTGRWLGLDAIIHRVFTGKQD